MKLRLPEPDDDGVRRVRLGFVEFAAVVLAIAAGWGIASRMISNQYDAQIKSNADTAAAISGLKTQVAVMNDQIATLTNQLTNVPALARTQAQIQAEVADHERRIENLENDHGVRVKGWTH